ncbi:MAG: deoxyhypusine synthase family protein [bacterium]
MRKKKCLQGQAGLGSITRRDSTAKLLEKGGLTSAGRQLFNAFRVLKKMIDEDYFIFFAVSGIVTSSGLAANFLVPWIKKGWVSVLSVTGAIIYHDIQRLIGGQFVPIDPHYGDCQLKKEKRTRIYDLAFPADDLLETDGRIKNFFDYCQGTMTTPIFHQELAKFCRRKLKNKINRQRANDSLLLTADKQRIPIFCGAPGDGSIMLNAAALSLTNVSGNFRFSIDSLEDIIAMAALQYYIKKQLGKKLGLVILGGGVPKNYILQGEPFLSQILGLKESLGFDADVQIGTAPASDGGLSGATASEAITWDKINEDGLADSQYLQTDFNLVFPLLTKALLEECGPKEQKQLYDLLGHQQIARSFLLERALKTVRS